MKGMFHLRIYLKKENGERFVIPAPLWLVKAGLGMSGFWLPIAKKQISEEQLAYIQSIDFKQLGKAFHELKAYKGLNMVDVKTKDGTEIKIVV